LGFLNGASAGPAAPNVEGFRKGLGEAGYIEGQNITIEYRWAEGHYDLLPALAAELAAHKVDVIAASGGDRSALAAKAATSTIPIVAVIGGDPVASGLVKSLAHPGGNLTGVSFLTAQLMSKRFELLLELVPQAGPIALLVNPQSPQTERVIGDTQETARRRGIELQIVKASTESEIDIAIASVVHMRARALLLQADPYFNSRGDQIIALTARYRVPAIYESRALASAGGLISYGTSLADVYRQVGAYVGKILRGAKVGELPVLQPTAFELVINLRTAKALGLAVPPALLAAAVEVID
jgi:putative ABC transport system substrate-binding protein